MRFLSSMPALFLCAAFVLGPATAHAFTLSVGQPAVTGSGKLTSEKRQPGSFQAVSLKGSMKLVLRPATAEAVELRGDDNLLPLIDTRIVTQAGVSTLEIEMRQAGGYSSNNELVVTVDMPVLKRLALSGSGNAVADGFKTDDLKVSISGSSDLKLRDLTADELSVSISGSGDVESSGRATRASFKLSGSGDVNARSLEADDVTISVAGSSDVRVAARKRLNVSIAGSGDVEYTGDAVVTSKVSGSGTVRRR